mmetsp:Transcript_11422/g.31188  ORF Transcript_11422/g.31188 Transcript_11422/m.31188 type:complete len:247 (-) Transcript_11422:203-943(-)
MRPSIHALREKRTLSRAGNPSPTSTLSKKETKYLHGNQPLKQPQEALRQLKGSRGNKQSQACAFFSAAAAAAAAFTGFSGLFCHIFHKRSLYCDIFKPGFSCFRMGSCRSSKPFQDAFKRFSGFLSSAALSVMPRAARASVTLLASTSPSLMRLVLMCSTIFAYVSSSTSRLAAIMRSLNSSSLRLASNSFCVSNWCLVTFCVPAGAILALAGLAIASRSSSSCLFNSALRAAASCRFCSSSALLA